MNDEQLESLLRKADESAVAPGGLYSDLADRVRGEHSRIKHRVARVRLTVALVGCYVAGMLTMWTVLGLAMTRDNRAAERVLSSGKSSPTAPPVQRHQEENVPKEAVKPQRRPLRPTLVAELSHYEILRQMGDESQSHGDLEAAVAYYGQALDVATEVEQQIAYECDNWLLISLKKDKVASQHSIAQGDAI